MRPRRRLAAFVLAAAAAFVALGPALPRSFAGVVARATRERRAVEGASRLREAPIRDGGGVAMRAFKRNSKKESKAKTMTWVRKYGNKAFKNAALMKQLRKVRSIAQDDSWTDEFLSSTYNQPVGGEYVMPILDVRGILSEIYGEGSTLENIRLAEDKAAEARVPTSPDEFDNMEKVRRKVKPSWVDANSDEMDMRGVIRGVMKYVGSTPRKLDTNPWGTLGVRGGSKQDGGGTDVWLSGASITYDLDSYGS